MREHSSPRKRYNNDIATGFSGAETLIHRWKTSDSNLPSMFDENSKPKIPDAEFGFVRFGELPSYGVSVNFSEGVPEKGVSCFPAEITPSGDFQFTHMTSQLWNSAMNFLSENNRPLYRLYGNLVGYGSDGEPLLKVTQIEKIAGNYIGKPIEDILQEALLQVFSSSADRIPSGLFSN